jgi:lipoprotein signal peptidase
VTVTRAPSVVLAATIGLVLAADQIAKAIIRHELTLCSEPPVSLCDRVSIAGPFGFLRTENGDGALGFLPGDAIGPVLVVLLGLLVWQAARLFRTPWVAVAVGLQLGGLAANLVDRALFGVVTDFIDVRWGAADQGLVLNPADIGLAVGGVLFAVVVYRSVGQPKVREQAASS